MNSTIGNRSIFERVFHLSERGTTLRTELIAGATTFLSCVSIMVLNPTIDTASLITDSPYLNLISFQYSYTSIDNIGSTDNVPKRARVHTGSVADISIEKMEHSITEKSIPGKK